MAVSRALRRAFSDRVQLKEAHDGPTGIQLLRESDFECIILDYRLPGSDGLEVLRKLREAEITTPVIMLTRQGDEQIAVEIMKAGASDYLTKDKISPDALSKSLHYAIQAHRAEKERAWLASFPDLSPNPIVEISLKGEISYVNPVAAQLFPEIPSKGFSHPLLMNLEDRVKQLHNGNSTFQRDIEFNGSYYHQTVSWFRDRDLIRVYAIDITERKLVELDRERLYRQALEADRRKDEFLAIVSHELRTPLTAILGWSELILSGKIAQAKITHGLEVIEKSARLQARIVEDLLDISKIVKGKIQLQVRPLWLLPLVDMTVEVVKASADQKGVMIETDLNQDTGYIRGDADRLQQIIWNLLSNAIKFTEAGGVIRVTLEQVEDQVMLRVSDNGRGIPDDFLPFIFDAFRQAEDPDTRSYRGLGIGLAIVRHLVELHGGVITAVSDGPSHGAVFTVLFPVTEKTAAPGDAAENSFGGVSLGVTGILNGVEVLVVEDDAITLEVLTAALQHHGAEVTAKGTASEALTFLESRWPHVLISDIAMPQQDGYSFLRQVKLLENQTGKHLPSIALTAYSGMDDKTRALSAGFHAYLTKPITPSKLVETIFEITREAR